MAWIELPSSWTADVPLDAHITVSEQARLQAAYDASGSDLSSGMLVSTYATIVAPGVGTWEWSALRPRPCRALRAQGDEAWRDVTVEVLGALESASANKTTLRIVASPSPGLPISTAGVTTPDSLDYADLEFSDVALARVSGTVTPTIVGHVTSMGIVVPIVWIRIAIRGEKSLRVYDVRLKEGA